MISRFCTPLSLVLFLLVACADELTPGAADSSVADSEATRLQALELRDRLALDPEAVVGDTFVRFHTPYNDAKGPDPSGRELFGEVLCGDEARDAVLDEMDRYLCDGVELHGDRFVCETSGGCWGVDYLTFQQRAAGHWTAASSHYFSRDLCGSRRLVEALLVEELTAASRIFCDSGAGSTELFVSHERLEELARHVRLERPAIEAECEDW